ncbi:hypothetical protein ACHAW5_008843 [Stephanodiscus triporus]|uniref:Menin n=1 Tax=Stephanodiscus triporus TaxID=2934178 RepID=A0ABD3ME72_9STRA
MSDRQQHDRFSGRVIYDDPTSPPGESAHRRRLGDDDDDDDAQVHEELLRAFRNDVDYLESDAHDETRKYRILAEWSCVVGYCEALSTHADASRRYSMFPVPLDSLRRLVEEEFVPLLHDAARSDAAPRTRDDDDDATAGRGESVHRRTVRAVSNAIWGKAQNKNSSTRDELHANSLYSCLRGEIDGKSLDCFGAALLVVIGMNMLGFRGSRLTLSEDHAYESHLDEDGDGGDGDGTDTDEANHRRRSSVKRATCEVAIPGNTKAARAKRGREISRTFESKSGAVTAETSWLYMAKNPVLCNTPCMVMAAMISNLNCDIGKNRPGSDDGRPLVVSRPLYRLKRDMLWILHECMTAFPFALMELGECEEHLSSQRGMEWVDASELLQCKGTLILRNEKLFLDAISISKSRYGDAQVYPYLYCGHYHRDAGRDGQEYRLVEALRLYSNATRVASSYRYDAKDCLQLMKHFTTVASLISKDILLSPRNSGGIVNDARPWIKVDNAIAAATWLLGFFDSLMLWEEREQNTFVEILDVRHKHSLGKLIQHFSVDIRLAAIAKIQSQEELGNNSIAVTEDRLMHFRNPRSNRFAKDSLLVGALSKGKVVVRELEMALPSSSEGRSCRERKKARS